MHREHCRTAAERAEVVDAYLRGEATSAIGRRHGLSDSSVLRYVKEAGYTVADHGKLPPIERPSPPKPAEPALASSVTAEIQRLKRKGVGSTAIAALLRIPYRQVANVTV